MNTSTVSTTSDNITKMVRPIITYMSFFTYIIASTVGLFMGIIDFSIWFSQIGTLVSMIISFWFGERSALKDPRNIISE